MAPLTHFNTNFQNISRNITAVFFKLGSRNVHHKRNINDICCAVAMTTVYAAGPVLIKTKIPRFYLKQGPSPSNNLMAMSWQQVFTDSVHK